MIVTDFYDSMFIFQITLEKSPRYFLHPEAPARIKAMDPNIKLLLIVRDPVMRLISDYTQQIATKYTNKSFNELALLPNGEVNEQYVILKLIL